MLKSITAYTYELDTWEDAADDILGQLKDFPLLDQTVGILLCDTEFVNTGIYKAVANALPFDVVGATTMNQAVNGECGTFMLSLMVLTADDVYFATGFTEEIETYGEATGPLEASYEQAAALLPDQPKLVICFPPYLPYNAGDIYTEAFETFCPGVPVFGTLAISSSSPSFEDCSVIYKDNDSQVKMSYILVTGNIQPEFEVITLTESCKTPYAGEITKSEGNVVQEVNGIPTTQYLKECGLIQGEEYEGGLLFVPCLVDFKKKDDYDGVTVVRSLIRFDGKGGGVFQGYMFQNSVFTIAHPSGKDILATSKEVIDKISIRKDAHAVMLFACALRRMTLGAAPMAEAQLIKEGLTDEVPFIFADAGGEIGPTSVRDGKAANRFHNFSIVACIL
jgi:hypothetical protein